MTPEHTAPWQEEPTDLSHQKWAEQEKSKENDQSPLQGCQNSEGSGTDGLQALRQVLNPRNVPLHQAFQVVSPTSPSDGKPQGDGEILPQDCPKAPFARFCSHLSSKGALWHCLVFHHHHSLRYFQPTPDCRASMTSSTKPECNSCAYQVSWLREGKHELGRMPAFTKPGWCPHQHNPKAAGSQEWQGMQKHMATKTLQHNRTRVSLSWSVPATERHPAHQETQN